MSTEIREIAEARKLEAEADKIRSEIEAAEKAAEVERLKADAEIEKAKAEARKAQAEAQLVEIDLEQERRKERELLASDIHNRTFYFGTTVSDSSVRDCMNKLTTWHRLDPECEMTIVMNSPGGDVIDGMALFDHILWIRE